MLGNPYKFDTENCAIELLSNENQFEFHLFKLRELVKHFATFVVVYSSRRRSAKQPMKLQGSGTAPPLEKRLLFCLLLCSESKVFC